MYRAELHSSSGLIDAMHEVTLDALRSRIAREWLHLMLAGDTIKIIEVEEA